MNALFTNITDLLTGKDQPAGWCSLFKAHALAAAVVAIRPEVTVEIGIYGGRSFLPLAMAAKTIGRGIVIGIDPWSANESEKGQLHEADRAYWGEHNQSSNAQHNDVQRNFMSFLAKLELQPCSRIIRKPSDLVEPPPMIDLMHLDGNHGEQALRDAQRFAPNCRVGALMFVDDIGWTGGAVTRAAEWMKENGWLFLYQLDSGAVFQRVK